MFYIIVDNVVTEIQMSYLAFPTGGRLEKTYPSGSRPDQSQPKRQRVPYVIEVMSKEVITKGHETSVADALKIFKNKNIHHLILTKGINVTGIVSDRDLLWVEKTHLSEHAMAKQFMAKMLLCCHEETPVNQVAHVMTKESISALPVINSKKELSGIITHHDLLKLLF